MSITFWLHTVQVLYDQYQARAPRYQAPSAKGRYMTGVMLGFGEKLACDHARCIRRVASAQQRALVRVVAQQLRTYVQTQASQAFSAKHARRQARCPGPACRQKRRPKNCAQPRHFGTAGCSAGACLARRAVNDLPDCATNSKHERTDRFAACSNRPSSWRKPCHWPAACAHPQDALPESAPSYAPPRVCEDKAVAPYAVASLRPARRPGNCACMPGCIAYRWALARKRWRVLPGLLQPSPYRGALLEVPTHAKGAPASGQFRLGRKAQVQIEQRRAHVGADRSARQALRGVAEPGARRLRQATRGHGTSMARWFAVKEMRLAARAKTPAAPPTPEISLMLTHLCAHIPRSPRRCSFCKKSR